MKERPILFSGPMVRALLSGRKTQTRRVLKRATGPSLSVNDNLDGTAELSWLHGDGPGHEVHETTKLATCPYGVAGDRLWVRESFWGCDMPGYGDQPCVVYEDEWHGKEYRAAEVRPYARRFGHIPGIHMPRDASRILLEVTGVRVERLHEITDGDAWEEGVTTMGEFDRLWDNLNAARGFGFDVNPYVWVIEFKRIGC